MQDIQPLHTPYEFIQGDVRDPADMHTAAQGVDMIVHTAAIHGIHLRDHTARDFYDLNLTGTFNMWEAAVQAGVRGVFFRAPWACTKATMRQARAWRSTKTCRSNRATSTAIPR